MNPLATSPLIHIGYHKTATTWLQQHLFTRDSDVFEPLSTSDKGHSTLASHFIYDSERYLLSPFDDNEVAIHRELAKLVRENDRLNRKVPVLSHERLSGNPHSGGFDAKIVAYRLKNVFPHATILIVIREQKEFLLSCYYQYLLIGGTYSLEKYLRTRYDGRRPFFSPHHINYLPLVSEYVALFGRENVITLPYEMFRNRPSEFVDLLGKRLGVRLNVPDEEFAVVLNRKRHYFVLSKLRFINALRVRSSVNDYSRASNGFTHALGNALTRMLGVVLPEGLDSVVRHTQRTEIRDWVGNRYVEDNKKLGQLIDKDLAAYGYY